MFAASDSGLVEDLGRDPGSIKARNLAALRPGYKVVSIGRSSSLNCEAETLFIGKTRGRFPYFPQARLARAGLE